ncbi:hypothetical protein MKW92_011921 [Papaver armeniacum]|nr:hypothetical protein MKW92_011921 [Papaver armeniacum]
MESQQNQPQVPPPPTPKPASSRKEGEGAVWPDMREHVDEFFSASTDEHKTCFIVHLLEEYLLIPELLHHTPRATQSKLKKRRNQIDNKKTS